MIYLLLLLVAYGLAVTEVAVSAVNSETTLNGFGSIIPTRRKQTYAPMRYRVLIPWLLGWIENEEVRWAAYKWLRIAGSWLSLVLMQRLSLALTGDWWLSIVGAMALALTIAAGLLYDYGEYPWELAGVLGLYSCAVFAVYWPIPLILFAWALLRETAVFGVLISLSMLIGVSDPAGIWWTAGLLGWMAGYWLVHRIQGNTKHYHLVQFGKINTLSINGSRVRSEFKRWRSGCISGYPLAFLMLGYIGYVGLAALHTMSTPLVLRWLLPTVPILGAMLYFGIWAEVRIFLPVMAPAIVVNLMVAAR